VREDAPSGRGEEVAHLIVPQACQPNEHNGVLRVVVREVVRSRIVGEERSALSKISADDKRSWFC
jgi:hypothetical protein